MLHIPQTSHFFLLMSFRWELSHQSSHFVVVKIIREFCEFIHFFVNFFHEFCELAHFFVVKIVHEFCEFRNYS